MIAAGLNFPYTIIGLFLALISTPTKIEFRKSSYAVIVWVKKFWWAVGYMKNVRAMTIGNLVVLGPDAEEKDLAHELIHVEQHQRMPILCHPLYFVELMKKGYRNNKYEEEAYRRAGNSYKGK